MFALYWISNLCGEISFGILLYYKNTAEVTGQYLEISEDFEGTRVTGFIKLFHW